nr:putative reverse transcriptase domain-containing protein [Tanacetum cinerariifolium]
APPSPNHVFNFPEVEFEEDLQEEPEEEFEEDPEEDHEEDPEEELEAEAEDDVPPPATPTVGSPITPPPLSESSSDTEDVTPIVANEALEMPPIGSTYEVGGPSSMSPFSPFYLYGRKIARLDDNTKLLLSNVQYLERCEKKRKTDVEANNSEIHKVKKRMDEIGQDLGLGVRETWRGALDARPDIGDDGPVSFGESKPPKPPGSPSSLGVRETCRGALDARPDIGDDGSVSFGESKPPKPPGSPSSSQIMPPKMMKRKVVKKTVKKQIAEAIEEYEKTRVNPGNASGSGVTNTGGSVNVQEAYNNHFHELAFMCLDLVPNEKKKIKRIGSKESLQDQMKAIKGNRKNTRETTPTTTITLIIVTAIETTTISTTSRIEGKRLLGPMLQPQLRCRRCQKLGHQEADCKVRLPDTGDNPLRNVTCYDCGEKGHLRHMCPNGRNQQNEGARARAYVVVENPQQNMNVVTGTFLLNDHYASVLFDSGAERSFMSIDFTLFIHISPVTLNTSYKVELADGKIVSTNTVLCGCTLALFSHMFKIDLLPTRLGSFDVIVGMDWLSYHRAVIVCYEKIFRIPLPNGEILEIHGERPEKDLKSLSCIKADKIRLDDICTVRDFPEVFPNDLTGLPPVREIEFRIDLIPGALPVVKSPYRLAPSEMLELLNQLKELQEKALPDGPNDFVVYCDASNQGFGCVLMQRGKRRWIELLSDYECEIKYHPGKANVVADALSRKERLKPRRVRAMSMTIKSSLKAKILEAQYEASKDLKAPAEWLRRLERQFKKRDDGGIYFFDRVWIPSVGGIRKLIMDEARTSRYSVHPGADKMYYDLRDLYWWPGMKRDMAEYVSKCFTCSKIKAEYQKPSGLLQQPKIPE